MRYKDDFEKLKRIEEIKKEISELQHELVCLENHFNNKRKVKDTIGNKENNCKDAEIERLNKKVAYLKEYHKRNDTLLHARLFEQAKSEAYKEFAERLKKDLNAKCQYISAGTFGVIDNLLKEMAGEE